MKRIERDNAVIHYEISGNSDPSLLFVHGSYIDQTYWNQQMAYFSPGFTVVTMDLPGHGQSGRDRSHWSVEGFAEDVITVIKELDLQRVILIGHSLAGDINLMAAVAYPKPIIGFIAIDTFKNAAMPLTEEFQQQAESILEDLKKDFAGTNEKYARMGLLTEQTPPEITGRIVEAFRNAHPPLGLQTAPEIFKLSEKEREFLPQLPCKLYLINVDYIPTNEEPLKEYATNNYEVLHMDGTCHYPMLEHPKQLNALLQQTIYKILQDTPMEVVQPD